MTSLYITVAGQYNLFFYLYIYPPDSQETDGVTNT